jgi:RimJ/RimL family protein N-acetyltransferase
MTLDGLTAQPVIETDRFDLRPLRRSDQGMLTHWTSDERVARMTASIPHPLPPGATEAYIARSSAMKFLDLAKVYIRSGAGGERLRQFPAREVHRIWRPRWRRWRQAAAMSGPRRSTG